LSIEPAKAATTIGGVSRQLAGAEITDIPAPVATKMKIEGVYVASVQPASPAAALGLRAGDIILAVNERPVTSLVAFEEAVRAAGSVIALNIQRSDTQLLASSSLMRGRLRRCAAQGFAFIEARRSLHQRPKISMRSGLISSGYLPTSFHSSLAALALLFRRASPAVAHGGLSIEELVVPFVKVIRKSMSK
jgi:membrane-associated protease RseP (regulator of RpoE activity)